MKVLSLLFLSLFMVGKLNAQDRWTVLLGKEVLLDARGEDRQANVVTLKKGQWANKGLVVAVLPPVEKGWERTITIYDSADGELLRRKGNRLLVDVPTLNRLLKRGTLHIYTMALPLDPNLRATIRVRRVHLCTLVRG
jgi:hypothetical protein